MVLKRYRLTLKHDHGKVKLTTVASSEKSARLIVTKAENCPDCAIVNVECLGDV